MIDNALVWILVTSCENRELQYSHKFFFNEKAKFKVKWFLNIVKVQQ